MLLRFAPGWYIIVHVPTLACSQTRVYRLYHSIIFPTVFSKIFQIAYEVDRVVLEGGALHEYW